MIARLSLALVVSAAVAFSATPASAQAQGLSVRTLRTRIAASAVSATGEENPAAAKRIAELKRIVDEVLAAEPAHDAWWSHYGFCTDLSGKWLAEFERRGMKLSLATTDGNSARTVAIVDGRLEPVFKFHVFLADHDVGTGECEILVDPSWQQFVKDAERLPGLPKVFVGTRAQARALFTTLRRYARAEAGDGGDPRAGRYEPASLVELLYSFGRNAGARVEY